MKMGLLQNDAGLLDDPKNPGCTPFMGVQPEFLPLTASIPMDDKLCGYTPLDGGEPHNFGSSGTPTPTQFYVRFCKYSSRVRSKSWSSLASSWPT